MEKFKPFFKKNFFLIVVLLVALFFWKTTMIINFFNSILSMLFPFILATVLAFIVNVPLNSIEKFVFTNSKIKFMRNIKKGKRPLALIITILSICFIIAIIVFVIVPQLSTTITTISHEIKIFLPKFEIYLRTVFNNTSQITDIVNSAKDYIIDFLQTGLSGVFDVTITVATSVVSTITSVIISLVLAIYILLQKEALSLQFKKVLFAMTDKNKAKNILRILSLSNKTFSSFITGQCTEALILGTLFVVVLFIFKIPFALLIGVVVGFTSIIPIVGAFLGAGIGAFLILIEDPIKALYFIIIFFILQQLEGNLIYPRVVGDSVGLPAIWVLSAVSIGGSLMGVSGILLFIPLTSVVYSLFKEYIQKKIIEKNITKEDLNS